MENNEIRTPEEIEESNKKILELSQAKRPETEISGQLLIHKRSEEDYKRIWNAFIADGVGEFEKKMGYSKEKIESIGIKKFIDAMDWRKPEDVGSWRTDLMHIYYCVHCQDNFAIFEETPICNDCRYLYDVDKLEAAVASESGYLVNTLICFVPKFKNIFLKEDGLPLEEIIKQINEIAETIKIEEIETEAKIE